MKKIERPEVTRRGFDLRNLRKKAEMTQANLAVKIGVSQAQISAWEKKKSVPLEAEEAVLKALGMETENYIDVGLFGGPDEAAQLREFFEYFMDHIRTSSFIWKETFLADELRMHGLWIFLGDLVESNIQLPPCPLLEPSVIAIDGEEFESPVTFPNEASRLFYDAEGILDIFIANYFATGYSIYSIGDETVDGAWVELSDACTSYIWWRVLTEVELSDNSGGTEVVIKHESLREMFSERDLGVLRKESFRWIAELSKVWFAAYNDPETNGPSWLPNDITDNFGTDMWDGEELLTNVSSQTHAALMYERAPDPFIRKLQGQVEELAEKQELLDDKVNLLLEKFEIDVPTVTKRAWQEMKDAVASVDL